MEAPEGVFIIFSAGPGQAALDRLNDADSEPTSVFTRVFVPFLASPDSTLVNIAKETQIAVRDLAKTTGHDQFPDYSDRVAGNVILNPSPSQRPPSDPPSKPDNSPGDEFGDKPPSPSPEEAASSDSGRWAAIAYENYIVSPGTIFGFSRNASSREEAVRMAIRECERESREKGYAWDCVVTGRSEEGYEEPVIPNGCLSLYSNVGGIWRFAKGATQGQADDKARSSCMEANNRQHMGDPCKNVWSFCSR